MSLFGGGGTANTTTTTTVSPAQNVTDMLEGIVSYADQYATPGNYIAKQHAGWNPTEQAGANALKNSYALKYMGNLLAPMVGEGSTALKEIGALASMLGSGQLGPTTKGAQDFASGLLNNALTSAMTGTENANVSSAANALGASDMTTANAGRNISDQRATSGLKALEGADQAGVKQQEAYGQSLLSGLTSGSKIASDMLNQSEKGLKDLSQANKNLLSVGEAEQNEQQKENDTNWENAMGEQLFPWEHADNMLNMLNKVSRMAGYTRTTNSSRDLPGGSGLMGIGSALSLAGGIGKLASDVPWGKLMAFL